MTNRGVVTEDRWNRRRVILGVAGLTAATYLKCGYASAKAKDKVSKAGLDNLHAVMAAHVQRGDLPGVVTLVSRGDAEAHVDAIGMKAFGSPEPMQRDTIFRIASMSKPVAGAAAMLLVEDGKLRLDEPVDRLLPELANRRVLKHPDGPLDDSVPANRPILVSDLLTLRMGLGYSTGDSPINKAMAAQGFAVGPELPKVAPDVFMQSLGTLPLMHQPGEAWRYHTGLEVLGVLIARASGQSLEDYLKERIFAPLGMKDTGFTVPATNLDRLPTQYFVDPATKKLAVFDPAGSASRFSKPPIFASAAGGLVSTADDYHAFARMMLGKAEFGGRRLLSEASVIAMTTDHITEAQKSVSPFSPGFWEKAGWGYGLSTVNHHQPGDPRGFGWVGGYGTAAYWDPKTGMIGVLLTQRMLDSPTPPLWHADFWRGVYEAVED